MTKLLAIETTDIRGSVACAQGETILLRHELNPEQRSAQSLVPAIDALLKEVGWSPSHLDEIAVAVGPGSFTGLRVGVTTAKILAWSVNARLYGIDTLAAIASKIVTERETILPEIRRNPIFSSDPSYQGGESILSVGVSAQRGDVAVRNFLLSPKIPYPLPLERKFTLIPVKRWLHPEEYHPETAWKTEFSSDFYQELKEKRSLPLFYAGPVLSSLRMKVKDDLRARFFPESFWNPDAESVALAAFYRRDWGNQGGNPEKPTFPFGEIPFFSPGADDPFLLLPVYSRESAAEERLQEKIKKNES